MRDLTPLSDTNDKQTIYISYSESNTRMVNQTTSTNNTVVTKPLKAPLEELQELMTRIWESRHVTNNGSLNQRLEEELATYFFGGSTSIYQFICQWDSSSDGSDMEARGARKQERGDYDTVQFCGDSECIGVMRGKTGFADVDPETGNMDPEREEKAITMNSLCRRLNAQCI